jgi:hypothetical protein
MAIGAKEMASLPAMLTVGRLQGRPIPFYVLGGTCPNLHGMSQ